MYRIRDVLEAENCLCHTSLSLNSVTPPTVPRFISTVLHYAYCTLMKIKQHREGPFSSLRESFKKVVRKSPFSTSRMAKDTVDDVLNSEAFLNKKVEMLKKQIAATQKNTEEVEAEGAKNWEEWGPQVRSLNRAAFCRGGICAPILFSFGLHYMTCCVGLGARNDCVGGRSSLVADFILVGSLNQSILGSARVITEFN